MWACATNVHSARTCSLAGLSVRYTKQMKILREQADKFIKTWNIATTVCSFVGLTGNSFLTRNKRGNGGHGAGRDGGIWIDEISQISVWFLKTRKIKSHVSLTNNLCSEYGHLNYEAVYLYFFSVLCSFVATASLFLFLPPSFLLTHACSSLEPALPLPLSYPPSTSFTDERERDHSPWRYGYKTNSIELTPLYA